MSSIEIKRPDEIEQPTLALIIPANLEVVEIEIKSTWLDERGERHERTEHHRIVIKNVVALPPRAPIRQAQPPASDDLDDEIPF